MKCKKNVSLTDRQWNTISKKSYSQAWKRYPRVFIVVFPVIYWVLFCKIVIVWFSVSGHVFKPPQMMLLRVDDRDPLYKPEWRLVIFVFRRQVLTNFIKFSTSDKCNSSFLIGSLDLGYQPLYLRLTLYGKRVRQVPLSLKIFLREAKVPSEKWQIWRGL